MAIESWLVFYAGMIPLALTAGMVIAERMDRRGVTRGVGWQGMVEIVLVSAAILLAMAWIA